MCEYIDKSLKILALKGKYILQKCLLLDILIYVRKYAKSVALGQTVNSNKSVAVMHGFMFSFNRVLSAGDYCFGYYEIMKPIIGRKHYA